MNRKRINNTITVESMMWSLILLFPITTLMQKYLSLINQFLFVVAFCLLIVSFFYRGCSIVSFVSICIMLLNHVVALSYTVFPINNTNTLFYFAFWTILYSYICDRPDELRKYLREHKLYICTIINISILIIGLSMFLPSSYNNGYFESFTGNSSRTCPAALFVLTLILVAVKMYKKRKYIIFSVIPMYCFLMGDSRTYLLVGTVLFFVLLYFYCDNKHEFYKIMIPTVILLVVLVSVSSVMDRITGSLDYESSSLSAYYDVWGVLTSGRSEFWYDMLNAWWNTDTIRRLFGAGFHFVYTVRNFWAHNDFIQLLLTFGIMGCGIYIFIIKRTFKRLLVCRKNYSKYIVWALCIIWLFNCFFNMFYVYMCALLSFPILLIAVDDTGNYKDIINRNHFK